MYVLHTMQQNAFHHYFVIFHQNEISHEKAFDIIVFKGRIIVR